MKGTTPRRISRRAQVLAGILILFVLLDALAYYATYRAATRISAEQVQQAAVEAQAIRGARVPQNAPLDEVNLSLNGPWRYKQTGSEGGYAAPDLDDSAWSVMELPQNWYLAGLNYHGVIWFRRSFDADPAWQGHLVEAAFEGVDYFADVYLNGERVGAHQGYFQPFRVDITDQLLYDRPNLLALRVESPFELTGTAWPLNKTLVKGIFSQSRNRPGGEWAASGQEYNTGGVWGDISLRVSNFITIERTVLQAAWARPLPADNNPSLRAVLRLNNHSDAPAEVTVSLALEPHNFSGQGFYLPTRTLVLESGEAQVELNAGLQNPLLWQPWDRGKPNLYRAVLQVRLQGKVIAAQEFLYGFRDVRIHSDWGWTVNGRRYFPRGTNYVSSQWLAQTDQEFFERDLLLMRRANLNAVRLTAHVEPQEFYTAADQAGMLVWQDFPLQGGYSEAPAFYDEAERQMEDMLHLLGSHPSIAAWCAHSDAPWATPEMASDVSAYDSRQNARLDENLRGLALRLDPTRSAFLSTGDGSARVYKGWAEGNWTDYREVPGSPFVIEYGAQALPGLSALMRQLDYTELFYRNGEIRTRWEFQDFQPRETFNVARIDPGQSENDQINYQVFIQNSQAYQANLLQFATEAYRRAKYAPLQGIFQYMFADEWPSITFSVLDEQRAPKPGYAALKTAMQPILPSLSPTLPASVEGRTWVYQSLHGMGVAVWVVNDTLQSYPDALLMWKIRDENGALVLQGQRSLVIQADEAAPKYLLLDLDLPPGAYHLDVRLHDRHYNQLGRNEFWFAYRPAVEETQP